MNVKAIIFILFTVCGLIVITTSFYIKSMENKDITIKGHKYKLSSAIFTEKSKPLEIALMNQYQNEFIDAQIRGYISVKDAINFGLNSDKNTRISLNIEKPSSSDGLEFFINASSIELYGPLLDLPENIDYLEKLNVLKVYGGKGCSLSYLPNNIINLDLKELSIYKCDISQLDSKIFDMSVLHSLSIIDGLLDNVEINNTNSSLERLDLSGNRLAKLPDHLDKLLNLKQVSFTNNPISLEY